MHDYREALELAIEAARKAGAILREDFHRPGGPRGHGSHADADDEAGKLICDLLRPLGWGLRCEDPRTLEPGRDGLHIWLIDPNDGTSSYLKGWRGSSVSIGALRDGVPILGVVYAYAFPDSGEGDLIAWAEGQPLTRNGQAVTASLADATLESPGGLPPVVFVSQNADRNPEENTAAAAPARYIALPSVAYRLARVAAGDGLAAVSIGGPCDWDYGAGHALLRGAGGVLVNELGQEVSYASDGSSFAPSCFGGAPAVVKEIASRNWEGVLGHGSPPPLPFTLARPAKGRVVADPGMLSRAQGCLLGQFAGDALGGLVEFRGGDSIRQAYPHGVRELRDGGTWSNLAGQPTDDSELALMLARTLVHQGRYDRDRVFAAYRHWYKSPPFDIGFTTSSALGGAQPSLSSQANGSLMRISPVGIFAAGKPALAAELARQDSQFTHPHPACQDACAAHAAAIAHAIATGASAQECYQVALQHANEPSVRQALEAARLWPPEAYDDNRSGWVLVALQNAFWQLLHAENLEEGVVDTVNRGGDTDTNGAIAGALLGAVHGRDAVPARWQSALLTCRPLPGTNTRHPRPQEFWPVDVLILAEWLLWAGLVGDEGR